ncbi:hypothetical protein ACEPAI_7781 [Sanghuangporus weigelae]
MYLALILSALVRVSSAFAAKRASGCTATINSLDDVDSASDCTTVEINGFTVPGGQGFELDLADGTTVNLNGDILFGNKSGRDRGNDITFNGNGFNFDGGGPFYWDGLGSNGGVTKPRPMMKIKISGTFSNVNVVSSPAQTFSVSNAGPLFISGVNIDNSQGDQPNENSDGDPAGHNADGFDDASATDLTIEKSIVENQDDCLAINRGSNIVFTGNTCSGGHGISVGSISSDVTVNGIVITDNTITDNDQAVRIKMDADASDSTVANISYSGNKATGMRRFGVLIDQSYPDKLGTPRTGVIVSDVSFVGDMNTIDVADDAVRVAVNCGDGACQGTWDWSSLSVTGGNDSELTGCDDISEGTF